MLENLTERLQSVIKTIRGQARFTEENISVKRPGTGISAMKWKEILGTRSSRDYNSDELI